MNNDQEIILAKISAVYDKPPFVKMETGQMEMILKCVGLGAYYDKYREYLEPYWYNGRFQNPVESYRIFVGLNLEDIEGDAECFPYDEVEELREAFWL